MIARVLQSLLLVFAVIDVELGIGTLLSPNRKYKDNFWFSLYSFASAIWSFFFGLLLVQTDYEKAYLCRCIGLIGTFMALICATMILIQWSDINRLKKRIVVVFLSSAAVLYPFICRRSSMSFFETPFGMSYSTTNDIWNVLYNIYSVGLALIIGYLLAGILINKKTRKRVRRLAVFMLFTLVCVVAGGVLDTLLPMLGYPAIPGSTLTLFIGTVVLYRSIQYSNNNRQSVMSLANRLFHSIRTAILVYSDDRKLVLLSDEAKNMIGIEGIAGAPEDISDIFELEANPFEAERDYTTYETVARKTGRNCDLEFTVLRDDFGDVNGYFAIAYDTSEKVRFIEQLNTERNRADEANLAKTEFLANMSHEIRTPINTVLGMNEMIRRETDSDIVAGYSDNIKNAGEALLSIINDILDFSKVEAGMMEIEESEYNFRSMLVGLDDMFRLKSNEKGLEFRLITDENLPMGLYGDEMRIRQVLMNLLSNAVKYTLSGSIELSVKGCVENSSVKLEFAVTDTGIGIRDEDYGALFESFRRFDSRKTKHIEGTGLGLSIVKKLADLMDAQILVKSEYGHGSTFTFKVEQGISDATPIGNFENARKIVSRSGIYHEGFTAPGASILVVDDNRMNLEVIKGLLKKTEVGLDTANSGQECIKKASEKKYHIIMLDHMMPGMDGIETLNRLKELKREDNLSADAVVIALTANAIYGAREMYLEKGFADYLSKPVESAKLEECIHRYLPKELIINTDRATENEAVNADNPGTSPDAESIAILASYGIDAEKALSYCGNYEVFRDTAKTFCENVPETVENLGEFREKRDVDNYRILIHAVKTNARTLGNTDLFEYALKQEQFCKDGNFVPVYDDSDAPERAVLQMSEGLAKAFGFTPNVRDDEDGNLKENDPERIHELIKGIYEALDEFDDTTASELITELRQYRLEEKETAMIKQAAAKCGIFDYTEAGEYIKAFEEIYEQR